MERNEYEKMFSVEEIHWWYVSLHELILETVRKEHARKGPLTMLDTGCGTGRLLRLLSAYGPVQGLDISDEALKFCRARNLENIRKADLNSADLSGERYEVITSIDVLYHRAIQDDVRVLSGIYTALKPDGVALVQVPAFEFLKSGHDAAVHTRRRYRRRELVRLMEQAGFSIEKATYRVGLLFLPIVLYRFAGTAIRRHAHKDVSQSDVWLPGRRTNNLLTVLMRLENRLLRMCPLPLGTSVYVVARKRRQLDKPARYV